MRNDYGMITVADYVNTVDNLSVIVSFSKFLGIAGLRTGAVFSNNELIEKIKNQIVKTLIFNINDGRSVRRLWTKQ